MADAPIRGLREAVKSGRITEERINESVRKILAWKYKLGLDKKQFTPLDSIDKVVASQETRKLSEEIADNAITLVKNEDKFLPLKSDKKLLFYVFQTAKTAILSATLSLQVCVETVWKSNEFRLMSAPPKKKSKKR